MEELNLKVGSFYERAEGTIASIYDYLPGRYYCFKDTQGNFYSSNGHVEAAHLVSTHDIVKELAPIDIMLRTPEIIAMNQNFEAVPTTVTAAAPAARVRTGPHKHAAIIKAWADGEEIEYKGPRMTEWKDLAAAGQSATQWRDEVEYRVKPKKVELFFCLKTSISNPNKLVTGNSKDSIAAVRSGITGNHRDRIKAIFKITANPVTQEFISLERVE